MSTTPPPPPGDRITAFTQGDPARGAALRRNLETIRERVADPEAAAAIDKVLRGEASVRDLIRDPAVRSMVLPPQVESRVDEMTARWHSMTPEQRAEAAREDLQTLREQRGPGADAGRTPSEEQIPPFAPRRTPRAQE